MKEFLGKHGAKIEIRPADFKSAHALKNAYEKVILSLKSDGVGHTFLAADSSPEVYAALLPCLLHCSYDNQKITEQTFEPIKNREDYTPIVQGCIEVNLKPFFHQMASRLTDIMDKLEEISTQK